MNTILIQFLALSLFLANLTIAAPILSCNQTPYPHVCPSSQSRFSAAKQTPTSFRDLSLKSSMNQVALAHQLASSKFNSLDKKTRVPWSDCLELFEDTLTQLNLSMSSSNQYDSQTWLSAAMTNDETCKEGFNELNLMSNFLSSPFVKNNVSQSLANSLAINKALMGKPVGSNNRKLLADGFPAWVSFGDRKLLQSTSVQANIVVAQDGSGNYKTISAAVAASVNLRGGSTSRYVIHVKAGTYKENVQITSKMKNLMLVGDGKGATVVTGSKNVVDGSTTYNSATVAAVGSGFIAQDITFQNTAGPAKHQAVAFRSGSDLSVFYRCSFNGYQDTLYVHSLRQFYRDCDIYGTVDFIFGNAAVVLQSCNIYMRKPMSGQQNTMTAQGRTDSNQNTGISIHQSNIAAASDLGTTKSYLGRPWKQYSRTVVMKSTIGSLIVPAGWLEWSGSFALSTLYYGEYGNTGAGSSTSGRVKWPGYHVMSSSDASQFTVGNFISGTNWIPATGVPYTSGL